MNEPIIHKWKVTYGRLNSVTRLVRFYDTFDEVCEFIITLIEDDPNMEIDIHFDGTPEK